MQKKRKHLTLANRREIAILLDRNYSAREIAASMGRGKSSIAEEIRRGKTKGVYHPEKAHAKARVRRAKSKYQGMKIVRRTELWQYVDEKLRQDWSPEEIAGRLREVDTHLPYISRQGIYKYIASPYGARFRKHLRRAGKRSNKRRAVAKEKLLDRTFIDERPKIVAMRIRIGDWEGDFIVSGRDGSGTLLVLEDRRSRLVLLKLLYRPDTAAVNAAIRDLLTDMPLETLTVDNDILLQKHEALSGLLSAPIFFCHPYSSWEKGAVENTNGLIRQYLPKGCDLSRCTEHQVWLIQERLNHRPRKCLDYRTPYESFTGDAASMVEVQYPVFEEQKKAREGQVECPV